MPCQDDLSSASFQQQNIADDDQSIPGEWDEFEKAQPLDKGADSIDNPENADDDREKFHVKKDTQSQLEPQTYTQTFKVIY